MSLLFSGFGISGISKLFRTRKKSPFKNVYTSDKPMTDDEYNFHKVKNQEKIDQILEKIKRSGYDSLSREEKEFLFSNSRR